MTTLSPNLSSNLFSSNQQTEEMATLDLTNPAVNIVIEWPYYHELQVIGKINKLFKIGWFEFEINNKKKLLVYCSHSQQIKTTHQDNNWNKLQIGTIISLKYVMPYFKSHKLLGFVVTDHSELTIVSNPISDSNKYIQWNIFTLFRTRCLTYTIWSIHFIEELLRMELPPNKTQYLYQLLKQYEQVMGFGHSPISSEHHSIAYSKPSSSSKQSTSIELTLSKDNLFSYQHNDLWSIDLYFIRGGHSEEYLYQCLPHILPSYYLTDEIKLKIQAMKLISSDLKMEYSLFYTSFVNLLSEQYHTRRLNIVSNLFIPSSSSSQTSSLHNIPIIHILPNANHEKGFQQTLLLLKPSKEYSTRINQRYIIDIPTMQIIVNKYRHSQPSSSLSSSYKPLIFFEAFMVLSENNPIHIISESNQSSSSTNNNILLPPPPQTNVYYLTQASNIFLPDLSLTSSTNGTKESELFQRTNPSINPSTQTIISIHHILASPPTKSPLTNAIIPQITFLIIRKQYLPQDFKEEYAYKRQKLNSKKIAFTCRDIHSLDTIKFYCPSHLCQAITCGMILTVINGQFICSKTNKFYLNYLEEQTICQLIGFGSQEELEWIQTMTQQSENPHQLPLLQHTLLPPQTFIAHLSTKYQQTQCIWRILGQITYIRKITATFRCNRCQLVKTRLSKDRYICCQCHSHLLTIHYECLISFDDHTNECTILLEDQDVKKILQIPSDVGQRALEKVFEAISTHVLQHSYYSFDLFQQKYQIQTNQLDLDIQDLEELTSCTRNNSKSTEYLINQIELKHIQDGKYVQDATQSLLIYLKYFDYTKLLQIFVKNNHFKQEKRGNQSNLYANFPSKQQQQQQSSSQPTTKEYFQRNIRIQEINSDRKFMASFSSYPTRVHEKVELLGYYVEIIQEDRLREECLSILSSSNHLQKYL